MYPRLLKPAAGSFFLFGPRGTGKTAWLARAFPRALRFDLLHSRVTQTYGGTFIVCWSILASAALFACTPKKEKTCAQEGSSGATLGSPWTELGVGEGEICVSNPMRLEFIVKNRKDVVSYARAIRQKLEGNGWESREDAIKPTVVGEGKAAHTAISWELKRGDRRLVVFIDGYPAETWKDDPIKVSIGFAGVTW